MKMITKEKLQEVIDLMPDKIDSEDIINKIILLNKIEEGLKQSLVGEVIADIDLNKTKIAKWLS
jgi:hypothetical protein